MIDEHAPHTDRRDAKKLLAIGPRIAFVRRGALLLAKDSKQRLVDERSRL